MKILLKTLMIATILSSIGLSFTVSYASSEIALISKTKAETIVYINTFTELTGEGISIKTSGDFHSFNGLLNKPLIIKIANSPYQQRIPVKDKNHSNKNTLFEMTTIFNDKLQSFIASIRNIIQSDDTVKLALSAANKKSTCNTSIDKQ